jgi:hypothetical protein
VMMMMMMMMMMMAVAVTMIKVWSLSALCDWCHNSGERCFRSGGVLMIMTKLSLLVAVMWIFLMKLVSHAMTQAPWRPGFEPRSVHVRFLVHKVALGKVSSEYFRFPYQFSLHRLLNAHHLSSGVGKIGQ